MSNTIPETIAHPDLLRRFERNARALQAAQPTAMKAFWELRTAAVASGALDTKTKELIALAISAFARCDDCIAHHVSDALEAGASKEEIAEALGVAILMGGGASVVYATHAIEALEQFSKESA